MLNLNLEVDLKLSQAEKARFAIDKEQADKNAFFSELERAEQAARDNTKNEKLEGTQKQSPEQQIGGNLHQRDSKESDANKSKSLNGSKALNEDEGKKEQEIGGNLHQPSDRESDAPEANDSNELTHKPEQQIGGNLHQPNNSSVNNKPDLDASKSTDETLDTSAHVKETQFQTGSHNSESNTQQQTNAELNQLDGFAQTDKKNLEQGGQVKTQPEQQVGGNLHQPQEDDSKSKAINEKLDDALKLDDSFIPKKVPGALDTPLKLDMSQLPTQPVEQKNTDQNSAARVTNDLLAQIQASSSQSTEVKQHLAPVPKALKDVLSQFQSEDNKLSALVDKKVDEIAPPDLDGADKLSADTKEPKLIEKLGLTPLEQNKQVTEKVSAKLDELNAQRSQKTIPEQDALEAPNVSSEQMVSGSKTDLKQDQQLNTVSKLEQSGKVEIKTPLQQVGPEFGDDIQTKEGKQELNKVSADIVKSEFGITSSRSLDPETKNVSSEKVSLSSESRVLEKVDNANNTLDKGAAINSPNEPQTRNIEQQIKALPTEQKTALQQSLQQAVDDGSLNDIQQKRVEEALSVLKQVDGSHPDSKKPGERAVNFMTNSANQANPSTGMPSYNSTKVTAQSLSETAQATVEQAKLDTANVVDKVDVMPLIKEQQDGTTRKAALSPQAENIFKSITALPQQSNTQFTHDQDIMQAAQQFDTALQTAQTQQSTTSTQRMGTEQMQGLPLNLQKNDAVKALQEKVNAMLNINNKEAEIRLDPPELGSMQIRIRSEAEQAQVNFVVQNQQAKEALEQSMPKLKEMLAEQGIELGESNIQQDSGSSSEQSTDEAQELANSKLDNPESQAQNSQQTRTNSSSSDSGIDYYA